MRVSVSHNKSKEEAMRLVDRSFDDLFKGIGSLPLRLTQEQRSWQGSTLHFVLTARMGPLSTPMKGFIEVSEREVTVDIDLGILERVISSEKVGGRIRGLLN